MPGTGENHRDHWFSAASVDRKRGGLEPVSFRVLSWESLSPATQFSHASACKASSRRQLNRFRQSVGSSYAAIRKRSGPSEQRTSASSGFIS